MRIGIDVGGTNTDAVLIEGTTVLAATKSTTTEDVTPCDCVPWSGVTLARDLGDRCRSPR